MSDAFNRTTLLLCQKSSWTADGSSPRTSPRISLKAPSAVESIPLGSQQPHERVGRHVHFHGGVECHGHAAEKPFQFGSPRESSSSLSHPASGPQSAFQARPGEKT